MTRRFWLGIAIALVLSGCSLLSSSSNGSTSARTASSTAPNGAQAPSAKGTPTSSLAKTPTVLVIDSSGSMATEDAPGPRMDAAKRAAEMLIDSLPAATSFASIAFGAHSSNADTPEAKATSCKDITTLTLPGPVDPAASKQSLANLSPGGYTPIGASLQTASQLIPNGPVMIVLVTDGIDTCGPPDPCVAAQDLKKSRSDLMISVVGFRADNERLGCLANATGGFYTTAGNEAQLRARLRAVRLADTAQTALSTTGLGRIQVGMSIDDIHKVEPDFPGSGRASEGSVVVAWQDCEYTFTGGLLTQIAPSSPRTIDGLTLGSSLADAKALYGQPEDSTSAPNGGMVSTFATGVGPYAWRISSDSGGNIVAIVLCRCRGTGPTHTITSADSQSHRLCGSGCALTSQATITHPAWGKLVFATFLSPMGSQGGGAIAAFTEEGQLVWSTRVSDLYELKVATPAQDSTGNIFVNWNPGRYNGIDIFQPTNNGFSIPSRKNPQEVSGQSALEYFEASFYYAALVGPGADGRYTIDQSNNDCTPSCAAGTITHKTYVWDGHQYILR